MKIDAQHIDEPGLVAGLRRHAHPEPAPAGQHHTVREVGVHLLGRRLYETMLYWETVDQNPSLEFAAIWKPLPKVVFSTTLSAVQSNARLASGGLAEEIERLRGELGDGNIAIGGATLAAEATALV